MNKEIEIMSPVGSYESLQAALKAGAGSVYFGIEQLNMRARAANNFTLGDLKKIVGICRGKKVKTYLTINTVLYDEDIKLMKTIIDRAKESGITAIIACDLAAIQYAHTTGVEVHLSTQANVSNLEAVKFYAQFADIIVLARELKLEQIKNIVDEIERQEIKGPSGELVKIEIFIHGALCVSISGKCYMSLAQYNMSANRGECLQTCRRQYRVVDDETGDELKIDNQFIMSPKDLCTIKFLDRILDSGVRVLKIEGRGRSPEYVYTATKVYQEAVESYLRGDYSKEKADGWLKELEKVFNRGFWHGGYYLGKKLGEWSGTYGSKATTRKEYLGVCQNYFQKTKIGHFLLESSGIKVGDKILITGPTTGVVEGQVESLMVDDQKVDSADKGQEITFPLQEKVRVNDKLFLIVEKEE